MSKLAAAGLSRTVAGPGPRRVRRASELAGDRVRAATASSRVAGTFRPGEPGRPERALERRAALADQDRGGGALGDDRGERGQVDALVAAAGDQHDRRLEGAQRGDHGVGLGPLRIVDEADAIDERDRLEAVLDAGEGRRGRGGSPSGATPKASATAIAARAFETLWAPGMASSATGMIRPGPVVAASAAGQGQTLHVVGDDPAVDDTEPTRGGAPRR